MDTETEPEDKINLISLPNELIILVLDYVSTKDVVCFGATCKQFNELVRGSPSIWKAKLKQTLNKPIFEELANKPDVVWYDEIQKYYKLRNEVHGHIVEMGEYFYDRNSDITFDSVRRFFSSSFSNNVSYIWTINILQALYREATKQIATTNPQPPYTLTEMHYAKIVLQYMIHGYLAVKWAQGLIKTDIPPIIVLNFFLQWVDPLNLHRDEDVINEITKLEHLTESHLKKTYPSNMMSLKDRIRNEEVTQAQVIEAISHVMYKDKRMATMDVASLGTLNIIKVLNTRVGHKVVYAAIQQAVAKRFGIHCELISFPDHLFLEWRPQENQPKYEYIVELNTGKLIQKRTCPFSRINVTPIRCNYCPASFLQYVISTFLAPMVNYKTWYMKNAQYLLEFATSNHDTVKIYNKFLPYLLELSHLPAMNTPINIVNLSDQHLTIITLLSYKKKSVRSDNEGDKVMLRKKRPKELKYAVGMVCYHREYEYVCVVRDWARRGGELAGGSDLGGGGNDLSAGQPVYRVLAADQSERCVSQDRLVDIKQPNRLTHLEDMLADDFTHFNGYAYVPNRMKKSIYPEDVAVTDLYRCRAKLFDLNT